MPTYLCVMSVFAARSAVLARTGRVLSITCQATRNFCCWRGFHRHRNLCSFNSLFTGLVPGWFEFPTEWKPFKRLCARGGGVCACLAHGMQCLRGARVLPIPSSNNCRSKPGAKWGHRDFLEASILLRTKHCACRCKFFV